MKGKIAYDITLKLAGERIAGTEGEKRAYKAISDFIKSRKLKVFNEKFPITVSKIDKAIIKCKGKTFYGLPYGLTVPFKTTGEMLFFDSSLRTKRIDVNLKNKIVFSRERYTRKDYEELKKRGVKGIITVTRTDDKVSSLHLSEHMIQNKTMIPTIDMKFSDAMILQKYSSSKIRIEGRGKTFKTTANNIYTEIKGTEESDEYIYVMGHYDAVPGSPGVSDNAGGIGVICELIDYFLKNPLKRNIRFLFFSGEEWGLWGSRYHYKYNEDFMKNVICGINLDVAGDVLGIDFCKVTANESILNIVKSISDYHGYGIKCEKDIYSSDGIPFSLNKIPTISIARYGGKPSNYIHTELDDDKYLSKEAFFSIIDFSSSFIERAGNAKINFMEKITDEKILKDIENYFEKAGLKKDDVVKNLKIDKKKNKK